MRWIARSRDRNSSIFVLNICLNMTIFEEQGIGRAVGFEAAWGRLQILVCSCTQTKGGENAFNTSGTSDFLGGNAPPVNRARVDSRRRCCRRLARVGKLPARPRSTYRHQLRRLETSKRHNTTKPASRRSTERRGAVLRSVGTGDHADGDRRGVGESGGRLTEGAQRGKDAARSAHQPCTETPGFRYRQGLVRKSYLFRIAGQTLTPQVR